MWSQVAGNNRAATLTRGGLPNDLATPLRLSIWLWTIPSAIFIVGVVAISVLFDGDNISMKPAGCAVMLVAVGLGVAWLAHRRPDQRALEAIAAALLLLAGGVVHTSSRGTLEATILLVGLPVAWLCFTFDLPGTALGMGGVVATAIAPYALGALLPDTVAHRWDEALVSSATLGLAGVTYHAGQILRRARQRIEDRSTDLEGALSVMRAMVESVDAAIVVFVPGREQYPNSKAVELYSRAHVLHHGPRVSALAGAEVRDADRLTPTPSAAQALCRAERGETFADLVQWVGRGEDQRAMVSSATQIATGDGTEVGTLFVAWDASEVLDSVRVRDEFLGTVGHELRTPLAATIGYLELHTDEFGDQAPCGEYVESARRQVFKLGSKIEDLLSAALPRRISTQQLDVVPLIRSVVSRHDAAAERAGLELELRAPDVLIAQVNEVALEQIMDNLVDNAIKYTESGSVKVTVRPHPDPTQEAGTSEPSDAGFTLEVQDTGFGINEREVQRVFDRFYRTENATRRVLPGLGVGLTVTKQLVHAHRGSITVHSNPGLGSVFRVTIAPPNPCEDLGAEAGS